MWCTFFSYGIVSHRDLKIVIKVAAFLSSCFFLKISRCFGVDFIIEIQTQAFNRHCQPRSLVVSRTATVILFWGPCAQITRWQISNFGAIRQQHNSSLFSFSHYYNDIHKVSNTQSSHHEPYPKSDTGAKWVSDASKHMRAAEDPSIYLNFDFKSKNQSRVSNA